MNNQANPIDVSSVFFRDSLPGLIFLEARQSSSVAQAIHGVVGVFPSRGIKLIPVEEMAPLLQLQKKQQDFKVGMWVRMKRGKYAGDLAQVTGLEDIANGEVGLRFLPRIDLTPREKRKDRTASGKGAFRPPAQPFNHEEVRKIYGRKSVKFDGRNGIYVFDGDEFEQGFAMKNLKSNTVTVEDVKPTLAELSLFLGEDAASGKLNLSAIADMNRLTTASALVPGDKVEVFEGEQTGLQGNIETVGPDVISIIAEGGELDGQTLEVPTRSIRKRFDIGQHVRVLNGKNADTMGMVVEVKGDIVTLASDQGDQEIKVFSRDIRASTDLAASGTQTGQFELHDMVMLE